MHTGLQKIICTSLDWLQVVLVGLFCIFLVWSFGRGFDIMDEGFYLLSARYPEEISGSVTMFFLYSEILFKLVNYNLFGIRTLQFILFLLCGGVFTAGVYSSIKVFFFQNKNAVFSQKIQIFFFIILGILSYYIITIPTSSYNTWNNVFAYLSSGFLLLSIFWSKAEAVKGIRFFLILLSGFFAGFIFFIKFPSFFSILGCNLLFLIVFPGFTRKHKLSFAGLMICGAGVAFLMHFAFLQSFPDWLDMVRKGAEFTKNSISDKGFNKLIFKDYGLIIILLLQNAYTEYWAVYLLWMVCLFILIIRRNQHENVLNSCIFQIIFWISPVLINLQSLYLWYQWRIDKNLNTLNTLIFLGWMLWVGSASVFTFLLLPEQEQKRYSGFSKWKQTIIICGYLFLFPFACAFGTTNYISVNLAFSLASWFALAIILILTIDKLVRNQLLTRFLLLMVTGLIIFLVVGRYTIAPPFIRASILQENKPVEIGLPASTICLDEHIGSLIENLRECAYQNGFQKGNDVLTFYMLPGLVYALGGKIPVKPYVIPGVADHWLKQIPKDRLEKAYILEAGIPLPEMRKYPLSYPNAYQIICAIKTNTPRPTIPIQNNLVRMWKPKKLPQ